MAQINFYNETNTHIPRVLFHSIAEYVLPQKYVLSVIFVQPVKIKKINTIYRDIAKPTDILSFPISTSEGEIYICPSEARKVAVKFGRTRYNFLIYLFIHGCVHLKGYDHGGTMEHEESKIRTKFKI